MNTEMQPAEVINLEVTGTEAVAALERAQVDMQIATAKKYPRSLAKVKADMVTLATLDEETAAGTFYTLPARKGGDGKVIQGPSVRMAEIALSSWGNIKAGSRVISDDGKSLTAQAVVIDLEKNVAVSIEVRRRVTNRDGRRYSEDMVNTTANAACSIALRNATFRVVPAALIRPIYEQAKRVAVGDVKSLTAKRASAVEKAKKMGATDAAILAAVGATRIDDIDADRLLTLIGLTNSVRDGEATLEDVFPNPEAAPSTAPVFREPAKVAAPPPPDPKPEPTPEPVPVKVATPAPQPVEQTTASTTTASTQAAAADPATAPAADVVADFVTAAGFSFDQFQKWAISNGYAQLEKAVSFSDIPATLAARFVKARAGLLNALKSAVEGGAL